MSTRKELIAATRLRYGAGTPAEKRTILDEFVGLTGYHPKLELKGFLSLHVRRVSESQVCNLSEVDIYF